MKVYSYPYTSILFLHTDDTNDKCSLAEADQSKNLTKTRLTVITDSIKRLLLSGRHVVTD